MSLTRFLPGLLSSLLFVACAAGCEPHILPPLETLSEGTQSEPRLGQFTIGPGGGSIVLGPQHTPDPRLHGPLLQVPKGALAAEVSFSVYAARPLAAADEIAVGPALRITPAVLLLRSDATVRLPFEREQLRFSDSFRIAHERARRDQENPMRRVVVGTRPAVSLATRSLGTFQPLVYRPPMINELSGSCNLRKIDVLFVIDNSPSMADKQLILAQKFRDFANELTTTLQAIVSRHPTDKTLSLHVGIITTDVGVGYANPSVPMLAFCSVDGDNGVLQATPCTARANVDPLKCKKACTTPVGITGGSRFISIDFDKAGNVTSNLDIPAGSSFVDIKNAMVDAFACRAFVGERGCGREAPFEAVRRSLANNPGFFRYNNGAGDSILQLVIATDEDDQSLSDFMNPASHWSFMTTPGTAGMAKTQDNFDLDFRGFAMSTVCGMDTMRDNLLTKGTKMGCAEDTSQTFLRKIDLDGSKDNVFYDLLGPTFDWKVLITGIWPLGPQPFNFSGWAAMYGMLTPVSVELEYDPSRSCTTADCLRLKRIPCNTSAMTRTPQHRLSRLASLSGMGTGPKQTLQADICNESEYQDALSLLGKSLAPTGAMMCPM